MTLHDEPLHIMLAEDDADEREFFQDALDSLEKNVRLDIFKNGKELLDAMEGYLRQSTCPNIVFLDLNMPILNGLETLEKVREIEEFRHVPVITILTTSNAEKDMRSAYERGANAFMTKPTSYSSLRELILKAIETDWEKRERTLDNFIITP